MYNNLDIQIAIASEGSADCAALITAMKAQGWTVTEARGAEALAALAVSGKFHLALLAAENLLASSRVLIRSLTGLQADMGLMLLVPDAQALMDQPGATWLTSDQVFSLDMPRDKMVSAIHAELDSMAASQPRYEIFCIDDDDDFLFSMEEMMPHRMAQLFPRVQLQFRFFAAPREALLAAEKSAKRLAMVICDQIMPEMKGIEVLTAVKRISPHAKRVLLTGYAAMDSAIAAINDQVLDKYLTKPIEQPADFTASIGSLLREHHFRACRDARQTAVLAQFEFIRAISAAKDVPIALDITSRFACEQTQAQQAMVILLDDGQFRVRSAAAATPGRPCQTDGAIPADDALATLVLSGRRPVLVGKEGDMPDFPADWPALPLPGMVVPLKSNGIALGMMLVAGTSSGRPPGRDARMFMSFIADAASATISGLMDRKALEQHYVDTMACLMETVEAKDAYTRGHTERVVELSLMLGKEAGLSQEDLNALRHAAALHDIGKIAVPDAIILKPDKLDSQEYAIMKEHSIRAFKILQNLRFLGHARAIIRAHHERYDGKGYPDGLTAEEIPLGARILAIADTYDAMTSTRPYREAMSQPDALAEIEVNVGRQFDPSLAVAFVTMMRASQPSRGPMRPLIGATEEETAR